LLLVLVQCSIRMCGWRPSGAYVGTECTLVHCSLYTGCIYRVLSPRELRNQGRQPPLFCNSIDSEIPWYKVEFINRWLTWLGGGSTSPSGKTEKAMLSIFHQLLPCLNLQSSKETGSPSSRREGKAQSQIENSASLAVKKCASHNRPRYYWMKILY
jgi:hypothetical protein